MQAGESTSTEAQLVYATWGIAFATIISTAALAAITFTVGRRQIKAQDLLE